MISSGSQSPQQPSVPEPALKLLDHFVGTWEVRGRTPDAEAGDIHGISGAGAGA
jgi:hypothetical protein